VTLSHEPIAALQWPAMTMPFRLAEPGLARGIKPGDRVDFTFEQQRTGPVVRSLRPVQAR
jgi:membrane fusion protein, copper/silver efflux system